MRVVKTIASSGDESTICVHGDLDLATAPDLRQHALGELSNGARRLILDLGGVDFIDSIGVGILVALLRRTRMLGVAYEVRASGRVLAVLELCGLTETLGCSTSAVAAPDATAAG